MTVTLLQYMELQVDADGVANRSVSVLLLLEGNDEPPHIHVERDDCEAKFWLDPVALAANWGFARQELTKVRAMVEENRELLLSAWDDFFGN